MTPTHFCDECRTRISATSCAPLCPRCAATMLSVEYLRPVEGGQGRDADELVRDTRDIVIAGAALLVGVAVVVGVVACSSGGAS